MAGLLSKMPGDARPPMADGNGTIPRNAMANPPPDGEAEGDQPNVSPEEQAAYDAFVDNALKVIFSAKIAPELIKRVKGGKTPVEGLASATVYVVEAVRNSAEKSGQQIPEEVLFHAGFEILENVATLCDAAGAHKFSEDEMEQAVYIALDLYATQEMQEGRLDPESALNDFQTMVDADKAGRLDEVIPGASAAAEHAKKKMAAMGPGGGAPAGGAQPQKRRA